MINSEKRFWKPLGVIIMAVGLIALVFAIIGYVKNREDDPLYVLVALLIGIPAFIPATCGYFMAKGHIWAARALRISIMCSLLAGVFLQGIGLGVFSYLPVSVPLISLGILWVILSFL